MNSKNYGIITYPQDAFKTQNELKASHKILIQLEMCKASHKTLTSHKTKDIPWLQ